MEYVINKLVSWFVASDIVSKDELVVFTYGITLIAWDILSFISIAIIGSVLIGIIPTIIYIGCFFTTRIYTGGYHANTHWRCFFSMIATFIGFSALLHFAPFIASVIIVGITAMSWIPILVYAPVVNKNKPLTAIQIKNNRLRAILAYLIHTCVGLVLLYVYRNLGCAFVFTLWIISANILYAQVNPN